MVGQVGYGWLPLRAACGRPRGERTERTDGERGAGAGSAERSREAGWLPIRVISRVSLLEVMRPTGLVRVIGLVTLAASLAAGTSAASMSVVAPPVSHGTWPERLLTHANIAPQGAVLVSGAPSSAPPRSFVLGFENDDCHEPCSEPLVRLDPQSGAFTIGPLVSALSRIETVGGHVLLFTAHAVEPDGNVTGGWALRRINVETLHLGPAVRLPFLGNTGVSVTEGISGTNDIWVGGDQAFWLLNTSTGRIVRRVSVGGFTGSLSLSPDGRSLYELGNSSQSVNRHLFVRELNGSTGQILATRSQADLYSAADLAAVETGVWITTNRPSVILLSSDHLRSLPLRAGALPPNPQADGNYGEFFLYALGPFVLVQSYRGMTCLDPDTGFLRATAVWTAKQMPAWTPVALIGHTLLAIEETTQSLSEVLKVQAPAACFG